MPRKAKKPAKPYPDFPLFYHQTGQWAKKVRGRMHYFGKDADEALRKYSLNKERIHAGLPPLSDHTGLSIRDLVNRFLTAKRSLVTTGELSPRTWGHYYYTCESILDFFGRTRLVSELGTEQFEKYRAKMAAGRGAHALGGEVQRVRTLFKFAFDAEMIDKPVRFGPTFKKPGKKVMRQTRQATGPRMIEAADLRKLIAAAGVPMKAMILLGVNCGFGNADVAQLPLDALDLAGGWIDFPRPKTAVPRRCPLWPETIAAIQEAISARPTPKNDADAGLAFVTKYGQRWVRVRSRGDAQPGVPIDAVRLEFNKLLESLKLKRGGLSFYVLRHIFRTVADGNKDQPAIDAIMGHESPHMASLYRERIEDKRLRAVANAVRKWIWPKGTK